MADGEGTDAWHSFLQRRSLATGEPLRLHPAEDRGEALVPCENPHVVDGVSAREVEQDDRGTDLLVRPPPGLHVQVGADVVPEAENGSEVEVHRKAGEGGQSGTVFLFFILVRKGALCHNRSTSLVMD